MMKRITFSPDELAQGFDTLQRAGQVEGMFLSSGIIKGSVTTQDKIIDTAEIIRKRYHFRAIFTSRSCQASNMTSCID